MTYLLDTNACVTFLRDHNSRVGQKLRTARHADVVLCAVVKAELYYGVQRSSAPARNLAHLNDFFANLGSLPFDDQAAEACGRMRAELARAGRPIGPNDLLIAAIAVAHNLTLVTHNTGEFSRVAGLTLEDWE